jgi:predicted  nucleic acid-binding Zn-ribbon protein
MEAHSDSTYIIFYNKEFEMSNERYLNHYVEILTGTMTDAVIRNISLQANARISEEVIGEQLKKIQDAESKVSEMESFKLDSIKEKESKIKELEDTIKGHLQKNGELEKQLTQFNLLNNRNIELEAQLVDYNNLRKDFENIKHQSSHLDTFRNELIKEREEHQKTRNDFENKIKDLNQNFENEIKVSTEKIESLTSQIENLQSTPAQKVVKGKNDKVKETSNDGLFTKPKVILKDGGSF